MIATDNKPSRGIWICCDEGLKEKLGIRKRVGMKMYVLSRNGDERDAEGVDEMRDGIGSLGA